MDQNSYLLGIRVGKDCDCGAIGRAEGACDTFSDSDAASEADFSLEVAPNPVKAGSVHLDLYIPLETTLDVRVFDINGRLVDEILADPAAIGNYELDWNGRRKDGTIVPNGLYFIRARVSESTRTEKVVIIRP